MQPLHYYLAALGDELHEFYGDSGTPVRGAAADSRLVQKDFIFVAIPGAQVDGARFARAAVDSGATTVVAPRFLDLPAGINLVIVKNAYIATGRIAEAAAGYPARSLKMLGVTGTNGKTTCAYLLRDIFMAQGCRTGMIGTVQYQVGQAAIPAERTTPTPFDLQDILEEMQQAKTEIVVLETSSHALHQRRPGTAEFAGALFTNLTGDHCDYHVTMDNYFAAKQVLFKEYLVPQAPAVINIDDPYGMQLARILEEDEHGQVVTFGKDRGADWQIESQQAGLDNIKMCIRGPETTYLELQAPVVGEFNVYNVTGTVVLAICLGAAIAAIREAVSAFRGAPGRMQAIPVTSEIRAYVDYAHTDDALANVLDTLRALNPRRIFVVFGCGGDRDRAKRARMGRTAAELADRLFVTSDNPRSEEPRAIIDDIMEGIPPTTDCTVILDRREAIREAVARAEKGDVILVAGKGHETYQEIKGEKYPFDDSEELTRAARHGG